MFEDEYKMLSGDHFSKILEYCGFKKIEFTRYIKGVETKDMSFYQRNISSRSIAHPVSLRWVDLLIDFVEPENYRIAYTKIIEPLKEKDKQRKS
jgi:hypothetical protein